MLVAVIGEQLEVASVVFAEHQAVGVWMDAEGLGAVAREAGTEGRRLHNDVAAFDRDVLSNSSSRVSKSYIAGEGNDFG